MEPSLADWLLFGVATAAYLVLACLGARKSGRGLVEAGVVLVGTLAIFFMRSGLEGVSLRGTLRSSAAVALLVLVVTRGQPARLFDLPGRKAKELRRLPKADRKARARQERDIAITQAVFLGSVIVLVAAYAVSGSSFLD